MSGQEEVSHTFRAMNTTVEAVVCVEPQHQARAEKALQAVRTFFREVECRLSRFNPESELSRLNRSGGDPFPASPLLFEVVAAAVESARLTKGIFDPTVLPCLVRAGYEHSFEKISPQNSSLVRSVPSYPGNWQLIRLESAQQTITLPAGCGLDLGGIGKGWTLDRTVLFLEEFDNYAINAGGDIRAAGKQADGRDWQVGLADPRHPGMNLATWSLAKGAVCTSTTTRRHWRHNGLPQHHLIDPRSGCPAGSGVISVSIRAGSAAFAETISKAALILGKEGGQVLTKSLPVQESLMVMEDGTCFYPC